MEDREALLTPSMLELSTWRSLLVGESEHSKILLNFMWFVCLFCVTHAAVDAILAFSTAELGLVLGSRGSFVLYLSYTLSALLFAKPIVARLGAKHGVLFGLCGMMCYVTSFFIALNIDDGDTKEAIWLVGAALGGIGAGPLWTAEGTYFSKVKLSENQKPNELLKLLMEQTQIHHFSEVIPSMNDIFISKVEGGSDE